MKKVVVLILLSLVGSFSFMFAQKTSKLFINHADKLYKTQRDPNAEILVGNVKLKKDEVTLICDSARYYKDTGSFDAFGHVVVRQADTLSLLCDTLLYNGSSQLMKARNHITLQNRTSKLITNILDYDKSNGTAVYNQGGTLYKDGMTLSSEWGQYNTMTEIGEFDRNVKLVSQDAVLTADWGRYNAQSRQAFFVHNVKVNSSGTNVSSDSLYYNMATKDADFEGNVKLKSKDYDIVSTRMLYNTDTELATIVAPTNITNTDGTFIYSERGSYDMKNNKGQLLSGSYIIQNMRTIRGDSLHYDKSSGYNEAFHNVEIVDEENKLTLTGDYCWYDEKTGNAMATDKALVTDWSEPDTVFVHADTLKLFTYYLNTDSVHRIGKAYHKVRMFRNDVQAVCDSLVSIQRDSCTYLYGQPIVWQDREQITGEEIRVYNNDSTINYVHVINQAMMVEQLDSVSYNQISGKEIKAFFLNGKLIRNEAHGNVLVDYFFEEDDGRRIGMNYSESTDLKVFMKDQKVDKIWMPATTGTMYPADKIPTERRYLPGFAWFDSIRPKFGMDVFRWESKDEKYILEKTKHREVPLQKLDKLRK